MYAKYLKYSLEELLEDKPFIGWVLKGENNGEWEAFLKKNPEFRGKTKKAREIILLLRDTYDVIEESEVAEMWQNIERFEQQHNQQKRKIGILRIVAAAASLLLLASIGTFVIYYLNKNEKPYQFTAEVTKSSNEARLVLSGGDEIALTKENSTIALDEKSNEVVVNDSIIDLSHKNEKDEEVEMNEVVIPYGKRSELKLADGTKVWLNAGSRLAFPSKFTEKYRKVYLEGEAYFEVTKNAEQPFVVNTGQLGIKVLGTHFNVSSYPEDNTIKTILLEGSVSVSGPKSSGWGKNEVILKPNQVASFNKKNKEVAVSDDPNSDVYIAWTEGWFQYSKESLRSVLTKLERYYNVDIEVPANFPSSELITGKLDLKNSIDDVMLALSDVAEIDYRVSGKKIYIDKKMKELPRR